MFLIVPTWRLRCEISFVIWTLFLILIIYRWEMIILHLVAYHMYILLSICRECALSLSSLLMSNPLSNFITLLLCWIHNSLAECASYFRPFLPTISGDGVLQEPLDLLQLISKQREIHREQVDVNKCALVLLKKGRHRSRISLLFLL